MAMTNSSQNTPLLDVRNLSVEFQTDNGVLRAADHVSFSVDHGATLGIVGESGCGKSVTAMSIPRLIPNPPGRICEGEILLDGVNLLNLPPAAMREIRGKEIGVIFQEPMTALSPLHRVGEQLTEVLHLHQHCSKSEAMEKSLIWLRKVGIPDPEKRALAYPHELSGGMRQRVMIAMAMILEPKLIIADEPTTALDVTIQAQILELMREVRGTTSSLLLITHDMGVIWEMCERIVVMYASRVVETGPVQAIFSHPAHPYTEGLLRSIPSLAEPGKPLPSIKGQVPSLLHLPKGCAFADRCPYATPPCRESVPPLRPLAAKTSDSCKTSPQRQVACCFPRIS